MPWNESLCWWLVYSALLSVVVLTLGGGAALLCRQPARRLRIIELSLAGCLIAPLLGMVPGYPQLAIGWPAARTEYTIDRSMDSPVILSAAKNPSATAGEILRYAQDDGRRLGHDDGRRPDQSAASDFSSNVIAEPPEPPAPALDVGAWLVALYLLGVAIGIAWWLVGVAALLRILWTAQPAPPRCRQLLAEIAGRRSDRVRLLASRRAKQPFASAWWPMAIVLPQNLCNDEQAVRWALAHEWTHIEQHDFRAWFAAGLARVLFFYQPLVWWLHRQLRLCQDFVADARASRQASQPEDYAEFLTLRAAAGSLHPAMVGLGMGFSKGKSELYRRIVMLVQNPPLESRAPRLWTVSVTCAALLFVAAVSAITLSPQAAAQVAKKADEAAVKEPTKGADASPAAKADEPKNKPKPWTLPNGTTMWESSSTWGGSPIDDKELNKLIKEKKYEFVKTFDSNNGEKEYVYRFTFSDGRKVNTNFSMPLEKVSSWDDYRQKQEQQRERRHERINQAIRAGRVRLLNLEVMESQVCRDYESGKKFKVQRIRLADRSEIALPRADYGAIPPSVKQTSWQEHLDAIRHGKRELVELETINNYTYEMTADDGTKEIFNYGGGKPLEVGKTATKGSGGNFMITEKKGKDGTTEMLHGVRPQGNCSLSGKVVAEATGKPVAGARMYLHYNITHGSIFVNTDSDGNFEIKDIPTGPFSLQMSHTAGYQDASYSPNGKPGRFPPFSLKDGEHRSGIVLKAKQACRVSGKVLDEHGRTPEDVDMLTVLAWFQRDDGSKGYESEQAHVNRADGSYVIDGLDNKPVYLMAINWRAAREGTVWPPIYYPGAFSRSDAKLITFDKSSHIEDINITRRKEGGLILEGTVHDEAGKPVPEAFVVVHRRDMLFDFDTAYTDAEGHYQIQGLGTGQLLVHVDAAHRGFVRTRTPIELDKANKKTQCDFTLHRGVLISGKFVDEKGKDWQIGESYGYAAQISKDRPSRSQFELNEGNFSLTDFWNKHRPESTEKSAPGAFLLGEGDYDCDQAIFPTTSTFIIQGMMPGHTMIGLSPNKEKQKVVKILYDGRDILTSGMDTKPGDEIKDVTIVIGAEPAAGSAGASPPHDAQQKDTPPPSTGKASGTPAAAAANGIQPLDLLTIRVAGTIIDEPIDGVYLVEPSGQVTLGPVYGRVELKGLTLEAAEAAVQKQLAKTLARTDVQVIAAGRATQWRSGRLPAAPYRISANDLLQIQVVGTIIGQPIDGNIAVEPGGTVPLGPAYGRAEVKGLTLEEAEQAIAKQLKKILMRPDVSVTLAGWKSDAQLKADLEAAMAKHDRELKKAEQDRKAREKNRSAAKPKPTTDQVLVEDLALEVLVAIREKKDDSLKAMAVDSIKGWRDALPHFALECRERFTQNTGKSFVMYPVESLVEGNMAVVKCERPKEIPGDVCLVLYFVKTGDGWRNWMLRNSPPGRPLSEFLKEKPPAK
jgi:beta-lactamase regulating signal transducer with metallopeptidase domain/protein involved in polysaccharide export with SLBB domain